MQIKDLELSLELSREEQASTAVACRVQTSASS